MANKRLKLKQFRVGLDLTQEQMAEKIGCERGQYQGIESGSRGGSREFWQKLQAAFELTAEEVWGFMNERD